MSSGESFAIPAASAELTRDHAAAIESQLTIWFLKQRWQNALLGLGASVVLIVSGCFLISQISQTPNLRVQMALVGGLLAAGGVYLLPGLVKDFFGTLVVDQRGIHMQPTLLGFSVSWEDLKHWEFRDHGHPMDGLPLLKLQAAGRVRPWVINAGLLSPLDQRRLRRTLTFCAPQRSRVKHSAPSRAAG